MLKLSLLLLSLTAFAQGPEYTGKIEQKPSPTEKRVNDAIVNTNKKIEIDSKKREVELKKEAPKDLQAQPPVKKKTPFIVQPKAEPLNDPQVMPDQYNHSAGKDPSAEFESDVIENRNQPTPEMERAEYVRQFKENAAKAGVKVEVDPKTMKAHPVGSSDATK